MIRGGCILAIKINYIALGTRIREYREKANLTQEKLAELCSLSAAHIGHIERGTRIPSMDAMFKIAVTLHISIDVLLYDSYEDKNLCNIDNIEKNKKKLKLKDLVANTRIILEEISEEL